MGRGTDAQRSAESEGPRPPCASEYDTIRTSSRKLRAAVEHQRAVPQRLCPSQTLATQRKPQLHTVKGDDRLNLLHKAHPDKARTDPRPRQLIMLPAAIRLAEQIDPIKRHASGMGDRYAEQEGPHQRLPG